MRWEVPATSFERQTVLSGYRRFPTRPSPATASPASAARRLLVATPWASPERSFRRIPLRGTESRRRFAEVRHRLVVRMRDWDGRAAPPGDEGLADSNGRGHAADLSRHGPGLGVCQSLCFARNLSTQHKKVASLAGLEPTHLAPEASALSN